MKNIFLVLLLVVTSILGTLTLSRTEKLPLGGTPGNLPGEIATTSTLTVGNKSVNVLIATTTSSFGSSAICSTRVISTAGQSIQIVSPGVNDGPTGTSTLQNGAGHVQAASTTVAYDSDKWGCGAFIVMGAGATTTITITETRQ